MVRKATKYFTAAAAEILLDKFKWSVDRTVDFLYAVFEQYRSMDQSNVKVQEYEDALRDDYGYHVELRYSFVHTDDTTVVNLEHRMMDLTLQWITEIMAITLLDKFGWTVSGVTRLVRNMVKYAPKFADGGGDHEERLKRLREEYRLDIRAHIRMGGETL